MAKIGVSICPFMTHDPANPVYCRRDCACFSGEHTTREGTFGYCGLMPD